MGGGGGVRMHNVPCPIRMAGCMVHAAFYVCGVWPNGGTSEASPATLSRHLTQLGKQLFSNAPLTFVLARRRDLGAGAKVDALLLHTRVERVPGLR